MAYTLEKSNRDAYKPLWTFGGTSNPSLPEVNASIKPLEDRNLASAEIEKDEVVFQPTGELYKALGNKHSKGKNSGTPVNLPENSFIFSDYKPLKINKKDAEEFKFKKGGFTPAGTLMKEIDIKHHNRMIATVHSDKHDAISRKSAELMIGKNFKKLGQVAYLQEEYKGFPNGLPDFANNTAPIKDDKTEVMDQQFQEGGFTPLNSFQVGGKVWMGDRYGTRRRGTPTSNATLYSQSEWDSLARQLGYKGDKGVKGFQQYLYDYNNGEFKGEIDALHEKYKPGPNDGPIDGDLGYRWDTIFNKARKKVNPDLSTVSYEKPTYTPGIVKPTFPVNVTGVAPSPVTNTAASTTEESEEAILPYEPNVPLSGLQKFALSNGLFDMASIGKRYPKRQQMSFTPLNLERMNAQPYINEANNQIQQAYKANQVMNPIIARAQNSSVYGRGLGQMSQILSQVNRENSNISNRENEYNNQGFNRLNATNVGLDNRYHDQVNVLNENYDIEKRAAKNKVVSEYLGYRNANDALELDLASQPTFGTKDVWVNDKGQVSPIPKPGFKLRKQAAPLFDYNAKRNSVYYTGAGMNMNQIPGASGDANKQALISDILQRMRSNTATDRDRYTLAQLIKAK